MADYSGEKFSLPTCGGISDNYWAGRWEFSLNKINSNTYKYTLKAYLQLTDSSKKAQNTRTTWGDYRTARLILYIPEVEIQDEDWGRYGPLVGGTGWQQFRGTLSGTFTVNTTVVIKPYLQVNTGVGSSMGTGLYAVDTWWPELGSYTVSGVVAPTISNVRTSAETTSSSITMSFDVNWRRRRYNI